MSYGGYAKVLRETADELVITVAVCAEREGRPAEEVLREALLDAQGRLTENGTLGTSADAG